MSFMSAGDRSNSVAVEDAIFECVEKLSLAWEAMGLNAESEAEMLTEEITILATAAFDRMVDRRAWALNRLNRGSAR